MRRWKWNFGEYLNLIGELDKFQAQNLLNLHLLCQAAHIKY